MTASDRRNLTVLRQYLSAAQARLLDASRKLDVCDVALRSLEQSAQIEQIATGGRMMAGELDEDQKTEREARAIGEEEDRRQDDEQDEAPSFELDPRD